MLDLHYWASLALKVGQDKPVLISSIQEAKNHLQETELRIVKLQRKVAMLGPTEDVDMIRLEAYEEKISDLAFALTNYRRALIQKSLDYVSVYFEDTNRQLNGEDFKLETKVLKRLVILSRDALKRIVMSIDCREVDVNQFLRLKKNMQDYLKLIIMHIAKAGVTPKDIESRLSSDAACRTN
mmetsp:Transcript_3215/g.6619  ORF Transcript_3215/g.6619 Transcript_3215/m.6619 type:complete len:182 (-) Transcript_3215:34-579(-)